MALTPAEAARVYDRIGRVQDWQAWYEDPALNDLLTHADLATAGSVLEVGCGTGRTAARMLETLPEDARYLGLDVSPRMVSLATERLRFAGARAEIRSVDGSLPLPVADASVDRVVSVYVFDLLDGAYAAEVLQEAARALAPDGLVCLASLTHGTRPAERALSAAWTALWRLRPGLLGGCRPVRLTELLDPAGWRVRHHRRVHAFGLVSEVVVAAPPG